MNRMSELKFNSIVNKYPSYRDEFVKGCWKWLKGRRADDNAEGLWRINDKLYDLTDYIERHPGGREWLILSKGTDITEAFEVFHLNSKPSEVLKKYYVRDAKDPRNYRVTFHEDGFFKTLRRRLIERLKTIDVNAYAWKSKLIFDVFVFFWIAFGITSSIPSNWALKLLLAGISGIFATFLVNAGHNFIHQRNSWRMYGCHAALVNYREFRVLHAMSHHMYPNSVYDLETLIYEPFFIYLPTVKTKMRIFLNYLSIPLIYVLGFHGAFLYRLIGLYQSDWKTDMQILYFDDIIGFLMPPLIFLTKVIYISITGESEEDFSFFNLFLIAFEAGFLGNFILMAASVTFNVIGLNVGHHGTDVTHEGDEFWSLDFGVHQLATTIDRTGANANLFMTLTHYGEHIIHHMIPSVDHSVLHLFRDILEETCKEFEVELKLIPIKKAALLQFKQLKRTEHNKIERDENGNFTSFVQAREEATVVPQGSRRLIVIPRDYTASDLKPEHRHLVYPFEASDINIVRKDRRGELFYYMHQQINARYNFERFSNNLPRVVPLNNFRAPIPEEYFSKLDSLVASRAWPPRISNAALSDINRRADEIQFNLSILKRWRDRFIDAITQMLVITSNPDFYSDLHNMGHMVLSYQHDPDHRHLESFLVIGESSVAIQITITGLQIQSENGRTNVFNTFWQQSDINLAKGMDFVPRGDIFARITHLQHLPYSINIQVNNNSGANRLGMVRVFLAPKFDERGQSFSFREHRRFMIEMDKLVANLRPGQNTLKHRSIQSTLTIPYERTLRNVDARPTGSGETAYNFCGCGWPQHMLTPKGTPQGLPCVLLMMISDYEQDRINQDLAGTCNDAAIFCGIRDRLYPDKRAMGYPFDHVNRQGAETLQNFLTSNMGISDVSIVFNDRIAGPTPRN